MESFLLSLNVILPLFIWMLLGWLLRQWLKLDGGFVQKANQVVFRLLLPLMLFRNMAESDFSSDLSPNFTWLAAFVLAGVLVTFVALQLVVPRLEKENTRRGVVVQGIFRSNTAIFGLPVVAALFGQHALGPISLLVALVVPFYNVLCVYTLEHFRGGKTSPLAILKRIVTNPLIIGIALGVLWNLAGLELWAPVRQPLWALADITTPLSFLLLGAGFSFSAAARDRGTLAAVTLCKLVLVPAVWLGLGALLGFRGQLLAGVLVIFAPPTAISSFPMACAMGGDPELSSEIVVFTSAFSILSIFGWVWLLQAVGLF